MRHETWVTCPHIVCGPHTAVVASMACFLSLSWKAKTITCRFLLLAELEIRNEMVAYFQILLLSLHLIVRKWRERWAVSPSALYLLLFWSGGLGLMGPPFCTSGSVHVGFKIPLLAITISCQLLPWILRFFQERWSKTIRFLLISICTTQYMKTHILLIWNESIKNGK